MAFFWKLQKWTISRVIVVSYDCFDWLRRFSNSWESVQMSSGLVEINERLLLVSVYESVRSLLLSDGALRGLSLVRSCWVKESRSRDHWLRVLVS